MFHQFCQFGGLSPQCRLQCGMQPQGPQFWGGPIPWTPPQQRPCGFPACERQRRGHHEHCHRRRECVPPGAPFGKPCKISTYGPCGRQFGGLWKHPPYHRQFSGYFKRTSCKRPSPFTQFGGLCQRQPPLCFPWRRQFPGNFVDLCERPPQFGLFGGRGEKSPCHGYQCDQGRHHDMKRLRRWRRRITRSGPSPPRGQWGRPEFKQHGPEMRHWRRQV
ncbi:hypothetical protein TRFO_01390 [Tritrichomonas foetus]|uniref:Uncharacterized protein n=1 Tax=Tritrichomonas foetus TaxID=1144522 RepID=A0A1J4KC36_9EUKA|nr:hypothetical protein TRFO_01390 [Tritrichomonas foetus]|eukprot:OHT07222.1 hypothetical protein TRFO_01390 [Tritrichomonas foetus]